MGLHVVYGFHMVETILTTRPRDIAEIRYAQDRDDLRLRNLIEKAQAKGINCEAVSSKFFDEHYPNAAHQGVAARTKLLDFLGEKYLDEVLATEAKPFFLILDQVTDPHNLGACLRSAEAAGVHAIIVPKNGSAGLTVAARKVSSGASEVLPVVRVTNLARTMRYLKDNDVHLVGTAGEAQESLVDYKFPLDRGIAIVMGNEGDGLRRLTRETCDALVKIPMAGVVSSLNVSVATGVCLFEVVRQKQVAARA